MSNQMDDLMQKCAVHGCTNHKHEGLFVGLLCSPCHTFISTSTGEYSQAYRNMREYAKKAVEAERERHRMQLAGISTAAFGYWKERDSIHPDYDTPALRDVAKLYAKIIKLHQAARR